MTCLNHVVVDCELAWQEIGGPPVCSVTCGEGTMLVPRIASIRRPPAYGGKACASPEGKVQVDEKPCTKEECPAAPGELLAANGELH